MSVPPSNNLFRNPVENRPEHPDNAKIQVPGRGVSTPKGSPSATILSESQEQLKVGFGGRTGQVWEGRRWGGWRGGIWGAGDRASDEASME